MFIIPMRINIPGIIGKIYIRIFWFQAWYCTWNQNFVVAALSSESPHTLGRGTQVSEGEFHTPNPDRTWVGKALAQAEREPVGLFT